MNDIYRTRNKIARKYKLQSLLCVMAFVLAIIYGEILKNGVIYGFKICVFNIIPTLFPFFILSDLWSSIIHAKKNSLLSRCFKRIFNVNSEGLSCFLIGSICGFPLGAKLLSQKYNDNHLNDEELNFLTAICNNPSAPFVISGIGVGLFGSIKIGIILYLSVLLSSVSIGCIFKPNNVSTQKSYKKPEQNFNLIKSIQSAVLSSISVASYIIFFSGILGVIKSLVKNDILVSIISSFLEIGSACTIINEASDSLKIFCLPLISFSLGFSGLSVFMQIFSILPPFVSKRKYIAKKLLQGTISALLTFLALCI